MAVAEAVLVAKKGFERAMEVAAGRHRAEARQAAG